MLLFVIFFITLKISGYDTPIGSISAYLDNLVISAGYILLFLQSDNKQLFSKSVSWYKMLGTAMISIALDLHWPQNYFLIYMTIVVFILDVLYLIIFNKYTKTND